MALKTVTDPGAAAMTPLESRTIAVLGFGSQGAAHALNLRDSGLNVVVGNRAETANGIKAAEAGFAPLPIEEAAAQGDLVIMGLPDEAQAAIWCEKIAPVIKPGATVGFLHGFNIRYELIQPPENVGVIMIAPKGPGRTLRQRFERGQGIPCLFALHQDSPAGDAEELGLAWANGIGCARAAIVYTTFAEETETDLFGEQTVLCGGMTGLIVAAFETLVKAGYSPELAYMECCQEVKQVADLVYERGLAGMMDAISNTAEFGAHTAGPAMIDDAVRGRMESILDAIRDGSFAAAMGEDYAKGFPWFEKQREAMAKHPIEDAGEAVRAWMPWLGGKDEDGV